MVLGRLSSSGGRHRRRQAVQVAIVADDVGPSLQWATAQVAKAERGGSRPAPVQRRAVLMGDHPILQFFTFDHLPERLADVSRPFADLAEVIAAETDGDPRRKWRSASCWKPRRRRSPGRGRP